MKKYLFLLMCGLMLTSCVKDKEITPLTKEEIVQEQYNKAFVSTFGQPASNQDWGFGSRVLPTWGTTRAANVNGNLWYQEWERPVNITDVERDKVIAEFSKERKNQQAIETIEWKNYWVQQVYTGEQTYNDGFGKDIGKGSSKMNKLIAFTNLKEEVICWWPKEVNIVEYEGGYEHINNFNNGDNQTVYTDDETSEQFIGTTLMVNMQTDGNHGSTQFGYHNSVDSKDHFEYIILEIDGSYYVGFDFYATHPDGQEANKNMDVERDWIFNDWIVKISPAKKIGNPVRYTVRIIAEDLSASQGTDFDFNDVVFDASYQEGVNKTFITLQAAGGTLPLFVAGQEQEVHELFEVPVTTMVNTGIVSKDPVPFEIDGIVAPWEIEVAVMKENQLIPLKAETGNPAAKIAVDPDFEWCREREDIRVRYPNFSKYVQDTTVNWY